MNEAVSAQSFDRPEPAMGIPSPGYLLSGKRKEYGWSTRDVARALHLSEKQVEAIEADDYASLPGKTYIMGYWRSYSQLLELPMEDSIQVHRANLNGQSGTLALPSGHNQVQGMEERSRKRAALLFAILLTVFLAAVWYWQDPDASFARWIDGGMQSLSRTTESPRQEPSPMVEPRRGDPDLAAVPVPEASILALPEPNFSENQESVEIDTRGYEIQIIDSPLTIETLTYQVSEVPEEAVEIAQSGAQPVNTAEAESAAAPTPVVETASAEPAPQPAPAAQPAEPAVAAVQPVRTETPAPAADAAPGATTTGDNRIVFQVSKESWIDVRDSSGERLIYRTVNRGEDIRLAGAPPYSVFIGSAEGVSVQYQGRNVPFKVHESGLFARFEVGAQ